MVSNMDKEQSAVDENGRPEDHARSKNKKKCIINNFLESCGSWKKSCF